MPAVRTGSPPRRAPGRGNDAHPETRLMRHSQPAARTVSPDRAPDPIGIFARLQAGDLDGALQAGLMAYRPGAADSSLLAGHPELPARLEQAQRQLQQAWAARERHRARAVRLARRDAERDARRAPPPAPDQKPALPAAAAAILARAKARAAGAGHR